MSTAGNMQLELPGTVESVVRSRKNGPLIAAAASLWIKEDDLVVDVTFGRGNFWTEYRPSRLMGHDKLLGRVGGSRISGDGDGQAYLHPQATTGGHPMSLLIILIGAAVFFSLALWITRRYEQPLPIAEEVERWLQE